MTNRKIGVLGSGDVGKSLSNGFLKYGFEVMRGSREPTKLSSWLEKSNSANAKIGTFEETAKFGDLLILSVKGTAAVSVLKNLPLELIKGKTIIDTSNPISDQPPVNGVLNFFTGPNESLFEQLQNTAPESNLVKAFSCVGNPLMIDPHFADGKPSMFICGNSVPAKSQVNEILTTFGWQTEDMGKSEAARAIEPLCMLSCIPGLLDNQWGHAFKLLKS